MSVKIEDPLLVPTSYQTLEEDLNENLEKFTESEIATINQCPDENLKNALILNRKKKYALLSILNRLKAHKKKLQDQKTEIRKYVINDSVDVKKAATFRLGMPYFKDKEMYSAPHNSDYYRLKNNKELVHQSYFVARPWSHIDKIKLAFAVYKIVCKEKTEEIKKQIREIESNEKVSKELDKLYKELEYLKNKALIFKIVTKWPSAKILTEDELMLQRSDLSKKISYLEKQIVDSNYQADLQEKLNLLKLDLNELEPKNDIISTVGSWDKNIDFLYISCKEVPRHTDQECKFMWEAYVNPKINKKPWSDQENKLLASIVKRNNLQNWEKIADELNLNKSPYQCCIHFFSKIWDNYKRTKWSKDEEAYLKSVVDLFKVGNYIPWGKVAKYLTQRSKSQIYKHYIHYMVHENLQKGSFTLSEDILLCALMQHYRNVRKAADFFSTRSLTQLNSRLINMEDNYRDWTFEDDIEILKHVEKYGECSWKTVQLDRSSSAIRHRFRLLKKWIIEHPGENISNVIKRKKGLTLRNRVLERKLVLDKTVNLLLDQVEHGESPEKIFNLAYIQIILNEMGFQEEQKSKLVRRRTKPVPEITLTSLIQNFLKFSYGFKGRNKNLIDLDHISAAEKITKILETLGAKLNIPDLNDLKNNFYLDEFDLKILTELKNNSVRKEPQPSTSRDPCVVTSEQKSTSGNVSIEIKQTLRQNLPTTVSKSSKSCVTHFIPPEPTTLIGFRGLMLLIPQIKSNASNLYIEINKYLPTEHKFPTEHLSLHQTNLQYSQLLSALDCDTKKFVLDERNLFMDRLKSLFKFPALMSMPENKPQTSVFDINVSEVRTEVRQVRTEVGAVRTEVDQVRTEVSAVSTEIGKVSNEVDAVNNEVGDVSNEVGTKVISSSKKRGRPRKVSQRVQRMLDAKKRRKLSAEDMMDEKKSKVEN